MFGVDKRGKVPLLIFSYKKCQCIIELKQPKRNH